MLENNMKIALVIFRIGPSHGSLLQTYALFHVLKSLGHSVSIINRKDRLSFRTFVKRTLYRTYKTLRGERFDHIISTEVIPSRIMKNMNLFVDRNLSPNLIEFSDVNLKRCDFDAFVIGSDQVWRPKFVQDIAYYYLDFTKSLKNIKRISYAASFGVDNWEYSDEDTVVCKELAQLFDAISVREDSGVDLCKKYLGVNAVHVLDPTMLLDVEDYINLIGNYSISQSSKTLVFSILDKSEKKKNIIDVVSNRLDLMPISIKADESDLKYVETSVEFWLDEIRKSSFVITDSFHATVFAIIFNKPFIVIGNKFRGTGRLSSLLTMFGLVNRMIFEEENINWESILNENIDWGKVNTHRSLLKSKSLIFLKNSLS